MSHRQLKHLIFIVGMLVTCALCAGCGSSAPAASTRSTGRSTAELEFSKCMRAHGVSGFPDPGAAISGPYNSIAGIAIPLSIDIRAPAFQAAQGSCQGLLASVLSRQGKPPITAALKESLIAHAQCMRTHGVPAYQDPQFPAGGGIAIFDGPGVNPQSPAFQHALAACAHR